MTPPQFHRLLPLVVLSFCLSSSASYAQEREHILSLDKEKLEIPGFPGYVEEVIDATTHQPYIGYAQKGAANRRRPLRLEGGTAPSLLALFQRSFPQTPDGIPLTVKVNHLLVYEMTYSVQLALAEVSISFWVKEKGGYRQLYEAASAVEKQSGFDVTRRHADNLAKALSNCCTYFTKVTKAGNLWTQSVQPDSVVRQEAPAAYPVYSAENISNGVWRHFNDFRDNALTTDPAYRFTLKTKTFEKRDLVKGIPDWTGEKPDRDDIWGLQWEGKTYIRMEKNYYQLQEENDVFFLNAPELTPNRPAGVIILGAGWGGALLSGALSLALASMESGKNKGPVVRYTLDMYTGKLVPPREAKRRQIEARQVFYASPFLSKKEVLKVAVDGKPFCELKAGEYVRLSTGPETKSFELCVSLGAARQCRSIEPDLFYTDVFLLRAKRAEPDIDSLDDEHRNSVLSTIRKSPEKERCREEN